MRHDANARRHPNPIRAALTTAFLLGGAFGGAFGRAEATQAWWVFVVPPLREAHRMALAETGASIRVVSRWLHAASVRADDDQLARIRSLPFVAGVQPVLRYVRVWEQDAAYSAPQLDAGESAGQLRLIRIDALHDRNLLGFGVKIGVLDTGFRRTHRAFDGARIGGEWDFVHGDPVVSDEAGQDDPGEQNHGAQTLSLMAGNLPGRFVGAAPKAVYYLAKTEDVSVNGRVFESHTEEDFWVAGLEWCAENGCRIVNSSLGYVLDYTFPDLNGQTSVASRAASEAAKRGILVVNAAGNTDGAQPIGNSLRGRIAPPADAADILTVGAATPQGAPWQFTAQGPTADGRIKPDVSAQGFAVAAVAVNDDEGIVSIRGTSASAPFVAGAAALLLEAFPRASVEDLIAAFRETASQANAPDNRLGFGVANAARAFDWLATRHLSTPVDPTTHRLSTWGRIKTPAPSGARNP